MSTNTKKELLSPLPYRDNLFLKKVLVITGGTSKLLYQIACDFMALGGSVAIVSKYKTEVDRAAEKLNTKTKDHGFAKGYVVDLRYTTEIHGLVDNILNDFGRIDILVNGASGNFLVDADKISMNGFKTVVDIDLFSAFNLTQKVFNRWFKAHGGKVIFVNATYHKLGTLLQVHASAAKGAVEAMCKSLALEWGKFNVLVNCVSPGWIINTVSIAKLLDLRKVNMKEANTNDNKGEEVNNQEALDIKEVEKLFPLNRFGNKYEFSKSLLFFCTDASNYITGQNIIVDGAQLSIFPNWVPFNRLLKPSF